VVATGIDGTTNASDSFPARLPFALGLWAPPSRDNGRWIERSRRPAPRAARAIGTTVWAQAVIVDPCAPGGFHLTQALGIN
jgi:hypothetical protein